MVCNLLCERWNDVDTIRFQVQVQIWLEVEIGARRVFQLSWTYDVQPPDVIPSRVVVRIHHQYITVTYCKNKCK